MLDYRSTFAARFTQIDPHLWVGAALEHDDQHTLYKRGVRCILSVAKECPDDLEYHGPMHGAHFGFRDREPMPPWMVRSALVTLRAMLDIGPTLVHCGAGISRSPTIIALYWMAAGKYQTLQAGIAMLRQRREVVGPHPIADTPVLVTARELKREWKKKKLRRLIVDNR